MIEKFLILVFGFCAAAPLRSIPTITQDYEPAVQTVITLYFYRFLCLKFKKIYFDEILVKSSWIWLKRRTREGY